MKKATVTHQPGRTSITQEDEDLMIDDECGYMSPKVPASTNLVLTQPGLGLTTTTFTTITQTGGDWNTGLFDVCDDKTTCMLGALVPCCLDVNVAQRYGEDFCVPLLPGSTFAIRVGIRERFKIRGDVCEDWTTVYCCYPLALCQMMRELKLRMKTLTYRVSTTLQSS